MSQEYKIWKLFQMCGVPESQIEEKKIISQMKYLKTIGHGKKGFRDKKI